MDMPYCGRISVVRHEKLAGNSPKCSLKRHFTTILAKAFLFIRWMESGFCPNMYAVSISKGNQAKLPLLQSHSNTWLKGLCIGILRHQRLHLTIKREGRHINFLNDCKLFLCKPFALQAAIAVKCYHTSDCPLKFVQNES